MTEGPRRSPAGPQDYNRIPSLLPVSCLLSPYSWLYLTTPQIRVGLAFRARDGEAEILLREV